MTTDNPLPRYTPVLVADPTPPLPHAAPAPVADPLSRAGMPDWRALALEAEARFESADAELGRTYRDLDLASLHQQRAEAERDRLSAELAAVRGAMPVPGWMASAADIVERAAETPDERAVARWLRDSARRIAALATATPTPPAAGAGTGGWTREPAAWLTFEQACLAAATGNGKPSTANMGPRDAAERGGAT